MRECEVHSWIKVRTGPRTIMYRCSWCGKGKRRYRPGKRPAGEMSPLNKYNHGCFVVFPRVSSCILS
jgi:hypothetical protein